MQVINVDEINELKQKLIKKIRKLKRPEKCFYLGDEGHQPGCSCSLKDNQIYNEALKDTIQLIKNA